MASRRSCQHKLCSILLTQIRLTCNCSSLNADLFRVNIVLNPTCSCGAVFEDAECRLYTEQRNRLSDFKFYSRCKFGFISEWKCRFYRRNKPNHETRGVKIHKKFGWLVGFGFNGPFRQYFSLYRAVSQREGERGKKG